MFGDNSTLNRSIPFRLAAVADAINGHLCELLRQEFQLKRVDWLIASQLREQGSMSQAQLVDIIRTDKVTISRSVQRLAARRLVRREASMTDLRSHLLVVTSAGEVLFDRVGQIMSEEELRINSSLDLARVSELLITLKRLEEAVDQRAGAQEKGARSGNGLRLGMPETQQGRMCARNHETASRRRSVSL